MSALPLNIDMNGRQVLIVGGGNVAARKLRITLAAGAAARVVSPNVCPEIEALAMAGAISTRYGEYTTQDLDGIFLVIAATDNGSVNQQVYADARQNGILAAISDDSAAGDCTFPAILRRGDLTITVSTGGQCPSFASDVRDLIANFIGEEYGTILQKLAAQREKLLTNRSSSTYNAQVLHSLARQLLNELSEPKDPEP